MIKIKLIELKVIKKILIIFISTILVVSFVYFLNFFQIETIKAGSEHNVSGYAWSENIGWISFNNTSGGGSTSYGVNIDSATGNFSGYAWSENVGWISFAPAGPYPDGCTSNCTAKLDFGTNKVTGWARACAGTVNGDCTGATRTDGWDGWIKMSGTATNGSIYGVSRSGCDLTGFAWGSDVVGWISFTSTNCDSDNNGVSDTGNYANCPVGQGVTSYGVVTTFCENQPPLADNLSATQLNYCVSGPTTIFSWQFTDLDGDTQSAYQIQVDNNSNFSSPEVDSCKAISNSNSYAIGACGSCCVNPPCSCSIAYDNTYYWRLMVWDSKDTPSSDWIVYQNNVPPPESFTTPSHSYPSPNFTPSPQNPAIAEIVTFIDSSKCYFSPGDTEYSCSAGVSISYLWDFDNGQTSTKKGNATTTYTAIGPKTVRLTITDNSLTPAGSCETTRPVNTSLPLPEWIEIAPF